VGQRIQHYRKLQGLSQEELGQKLLVSRQTVSLWENDQTLPTIDNLVRLKEIFGVTIDEILDNKSEQREETASEQYHFRFSYNELTLLRDVSAHRAYSSALGAVVGLLITVIWGNLIPDSLPFVTSLYVAMLVVGAGEFFHLHKKWKNKMSAMLRQTLVYDVHENYMEIRIYEAERLLHLHWVPYSELKKIREKKGCMFFSFEDIWFMVRKADLQEGSLLYKALITYWASSHSE
jgi:transcriptional regulator with XRE-family HTH domain